MAAYPSPPAPRQPHQQHHQQYHYHQHQHQRQKQQSSYQQQNHFQEQQHRMLSKAPPSHYLNHHPLAQAQKSGMLTAKELTGAPLISYVPKNRKLKKKTSE